MASVSVSCFNDDGKTFVGVSVDGRVRVWDVEASTLRGQYQKKDHLSIQYTSVAWGKSAKAGGKKRRRGKDLGQLALGTGKGGLVVWDLASSAIVHEVGQSGEHSGPVQHVAFNAAGSRLYSCSAAKKVCEWNAASGELLRKVKGLDHGATRLAVRGEKLVVAGTGIRVADVSGSGKAAKLRQFTGHDSDINVLAMTHDEKLVVSGAGRFLSVWSMAEEDDSAANVPVSSLSLPAAAKCSSVDTALFTRKSYLVAAVLDTGSVCIWQVGGASAKKPSQKPVSVISGPKGSRILAVKLLVNGKGGCKGSLTAVRGSATTPVFEEVSFLDDDGQFIAEVQLQDDDDTAAAGGKDTRLAVEDAGAKAVDVPATSLQLDGEVVKPALQPMPTISSSSASAGAGVGAGAGSAEEQEALQHVPLAERVEALAATMEGLGEVGVEEGARLTGKKRKRTPVVAASLQAVLEQALQTQDDAQLEYCLSVTDPVVIEGTVARLPTAKVLPFLARVVQRFEKRPGHALELVAWMRAVLILHASYLMSVPGLMHKMSRLYQTIDARLKMYPKLLKLSGRLDLVLSQLGRRDPTSLEEDGAGRVYTEGASDAEEESDSDGSGDSSEEDEDEDMGEDDSSDAESDDEESS